jgi:predicted acyl esterase
VLLVGLAAWIPWHERGGWADTRRRRWAHRVVGVVAGALVLFYVVFPVSLALWTTHKFRTEVGTFAVPHQDVTFRTSDGLQLSGWYVPSRNGAAVVIVHGGGGSRDGARLHARMLAHAGYGVLLYDARGRGRSDGDTDAYGWTWGRDVDAAIRFLQRRPDVQQGRIGALGLSTGADVLVEVAARRHDLRAVVADGSTSRSLDDTVRITRGGDWLSIPFWWTQYTAAEVLEGARPGPALAKLAARTAPTRILFIASSWPVEREAAPIYARAAGKRAELWKVDAGHTQGLRDHPRQYTRRVVGFFDRVLRADR